MASDITQTVVTKLELDNSSYIKGLEKQEDQQDDTNKATEEGTEATAEMTGALDSMAGALGVNVGAMKSTVKGLGTVSKGFKTLRGAIIATGIGALVIALAALFAWFTRTKEGQEKLAVAMAGMGAVIDVLMDTLADLGGALFKVFEDPKQAVKDLWEVIKTNLINRVKAIPLLFKAVGKVMQSALKFDWDGVNDGLKDVATSTVQLSTGLDEIQQNDVLGFVAEKAKEVVSETKKAVAIQKEANALEQKKIDFLTNEARLEVKIAEEKTKAATVEGQTNQERLDAINNALKLTKQLQAERKALLSEELAQLQAVQDLGHNTIEDDRQREELKKQIILLDKQQADSMKELVGQQGALINGVKAEAKAKIDAAAAIDKAEKDLQDAKDQKQAEKEAVAKQKLEELKLQQQEQQAQEIVDAQVRQQTLIALEEERLRKQLTDTELTLSEIEVLKMGSVKRIAAIDKTASDEQKKREDQGLSDSLTLLNTLAEENKELATVAALVNAAAGAQKTIANLGLPFAIPALITQGILLKKSLSNIQKAEHGAYLTGASHSNGGIPIEAEGGEVIINKHATKRFLPLLSAINQSAGNGVPLAARGMLVGEASGRSAISNLSGSINGALSEQKTVLVTEDLNQVQSRVAVTESIATL